MASDCNDLAKETKDIITGLLISTPLKVTVNNLCHDYRQMVGRDIPHKELGYSTVYDYLYSITDTVTVIGCGKYAELQPVIKEKSSHINKLVMKQRVPKPDIRKKHNRRSLPVQQNHKSFVGQSNGHLHKIPWEIQNNLLKLIQRFPNGLLCSQLAVEYKKRFNKTLKPEQLGYNSFRAMCMDLKDIFCYQELTPNDLKLIKPAITNQLLLDQREEIINSPSSKIEWNLNLVPRNVHLFEKIPRLKPPKIGNVITCEITEIFSPSKFFLYIKNGSLEQFQQKLEKFFQLEHHNYVIPELLIEEKLYCVVNLGQYCRAVVINTKIQDKIKILFIDYGFVTTVKSNQIYYLPKVFARLPSQAIQCKLFNLSPNEFNWSQDCLKRFRELVRYKQTVGKVMKVDMIRNIIEIDLICHQMIDINNILVEEELAVNTIQDLLSKTL